MNPATGPKSVSFRLSATGIVSGLGTMITGLVQNPNALNNAASAVTDVRTAVGALIVAVSIAAKLFHDNGLNKATLAAAGNEMASALPGIKADLSNAATLVGSDFPLLKESFVAFQTDVTTQLSNVENHIASITGVTPQMVEDAVRKILAAGSSVAPAAPAAAPTGQPAQPVIPS
jgi:hypothetical protein